MIPSYQIKSFFKRLSPFHIFLLTISPIMLSLIIHLSILFFSGNVTWRYSDSAPIEIDIPARVVVEEKKVDGLRFQETDRLDSFMVKRDTVHPTPEVEYRPVTGVFTSYPDQKAGEGFDIIGIESASLGNELVYPSVTGRPHFYTAPEKHTGSFSRHISTLREHGLDVVFVFDSTLSMGPYLRAVKFKLKNLIASLKKLAPTCRIGFVTYRDRPDTYLTLLHPLTYSTSALYDFLAGIKAEGGMDREEAVEEGLKVAVEKMKWNMESKKFILLIGDAPPHEKDMPLAFDAIRKFREEMGGRLSVIDTRRPDSTPKDYSRELLNTPSNLLPEEIINSVDRQSVMDEFRVFAEAGGGESSRMIDEEKVVKNMLLLIFGARWEMYLDEFMKNL